MVMTGLWSGRHLFSEGFFNLERCRLVFALTRNDHMRIRFRKSFLREPVVAKIVAEHSVVETY